MSYTLQEPADGLGAVRPVPVRRRKARRWTLGIVVFVAVAFLGTRLMIVRSFDTGPLPLPLASLRHLPVTLPDGRRAQLGDGLRPGVPTVVTLWASWCGPCRLEAPGIAELRRRFGRDRLNIIYANVRDAGAERDDLARHMEEYGMGRDDYVVMDDSHAAELTRASNNPIPRTLVFDSSGTAVASITGYKPLALARIAGLIER